jgi:hydroxypyruvate isomerase
MPFRGNLRYPALMRIAANISWLFAEVPMLDRPALAMAEGFDGIEVLFPYDHPAADWHAALQGCLVALLNTPPGDWAAGGRGWAAVAGAERQFRAGFGQALDLAQAIGAERIHVMSGNAAGPEAEAAFRANLEWACTQGHPLTVEPLNTRDMPGYFLNSYAQALRLTEGLPVAVQFDSWHAGAMGGVAAEWGLAGRRSGHIQIAGSAARNEPDDDILHFVRQAVALGYAGWVAGEYRPLGTTSAGTGWLKRLRTV